MDELTRALIDGLYRHVRRMFGDAAFDEGTLRVRGATVEELERSRGRIAALRDVLDLFDAVLGEDASAGRGAPH
jgi:hypothetical protein